LLCTLLSGLLLLALLSGPLLLLALWGRLLLLSLRGCPLLLCTLLGRLLLLTLRSCPLLRSRLGRPLPWSRGFPTIALVTESLYVGCLGRNPLLRRVVDPLESQ
jgi:hypothetical protein